MLPPPPPPGATYVPNTKPNLRAQAAKWITDHPETYALFERYALEAARMGRRFGIGFLAERVRWECFFQKDTGAQYKINNNYRAYIARKLVRDHPHLERLIQFRKTQS